MKKRAEKIIAVVGIACFIITGIFIAVTGSVKKTAYNIIIQTTDALGVADGTYDSHCEVAPVRVTVVDQKITDIILLEHENGLGGKADVIADDILARQSLDVDTISGATVSRKAILKSIENALQSGRPLDNEK